MGRQIYLTRLALGRSPYQSVATQHGLQEVSDETASAEPSSALNNGQQYDMKGRPVNRATEDRNTRMRRAQNSILKLVGVVEDKEHSDRENELLIRLRREARQRTLQSEDDRGEMVELLTVISRPMFTWWLECFVQRIQVGLYDPQLSLESILRYEWQLMAHTGLRGAILAMYPGAIAFGTYTVGRMVAASAMDGITQVVAGFVWTRSRPLSRSRQESIDDLVRHALDAVRFVLDVALLPLMFYSTAQQTGVAPSLPLLPPMRSLLPGTTGLCGAAWKPCWDWPVVGSLCTPAALLLAHAYLQGEGDEGTPIARELTDFSYPAIDDHDHNVTAPIFRRDPLGRILYEGYRIRLRIMRWCGWSVMRGSSCAQFEANLVSDSGLPRRTHHRSTRLAQMPAKYLSWRLDDLFVKNVTIPFESMMLNVVVNAYISSSLPLTELGLGAARRLSLPFFDQARGSFGWAAKHDGYFGTYLFRLGLTLGLRVAAETIMFGGVYRLVRAQGVNNFGWASIGIDGS